VHTAIPFDRFGYNLADVCGLCQMGSLIPRGRRDLGVEPVAKSPKHAIAKCMLPPDE